MKKGHFENSPVVSLRLCLGNFSFRLALPLNVPLSWLPFFHLKMEKLFKSPVAPRSKADGPSGQGLAE